MNVQVSQDEAEQEDLKALETIKQLKEEKVSAG